MAEYSWLLCTAHTVFTGFVHILFGAKVQWFFKDFSFHKFTCNMQTSQTMRAWKHVQTRHSLCTSGSMDMYESNKRALVTSFKAFQEFYTLITCREQLFSLAFISFKTYKHQYFSGLFNKKSRTFQDKKTISSNFKALK